MQGGVIATSGSINGNLTIGGPLSGQIVAVGNINGNVTINGALQSGRIAALGSILGNLTINGVDRQPERHRLGRLHRRQDPRHGLYCRQCQWNSGRGGADERHQDRQYEPGPAYKQNDTTDAAVIDAIFSQGLLSPLSPTDLFDHATLVGSGKPQRQIVINLNSLIVKSGKLQL